MFSMTGFGQAEKSFETMDISAEIRSVNSRYLDIKLRLPKRASFFEPQLRTLVQEKLSRGRVEVTLQVSTQSSDRFRIDSNLVSNYLKMASHLRSLGVAGDLDISACLQLPGALVSNDSAQSRESFSDALLTVATTALDQLLAARQAEGILLMRDLETRIQILESAQKRLEALSENVFQHQREKLKKRLVETKSTFPLDEGRLAQEITYYAARSDISEELSRLDSHLFRFSEKLLNKVSEPRGKELDFLCQEMNREITTILSKSSLPQVSDLALEAKGEIEKIREQVQNVE